MVAVGLLAAVHTTVTPKNRKDRQPMNVIVKRLIFIFPPVKIFSLRDTVLNLSDKVRT